MSMDNVLDSGIGLENQLKEEVTSLWSEHVRVSGAKKATTAELRQLRTKLAEKLYNMKQVLSRIGRGGQWRGWLGEVRIPRSTADRLVERHAESLGVSAANVPTESISPQEEVGRLVQSLLPRLRRLSSPTKLYQFVCVLAEQLGLTCTTTEGGILLTRPTSEQKTAAEAEPCFHSDGVVEDGDDVPSESGFETGQVTLGEEMANSSL
jgi:hypothetical protein